MSAATENNKAKKIRKLLDLDIKVTKENIPRIVTFILFISFLLILYIANIYYSEKIIIKSNKLSKEIKELRAESITIKAELMNYSKQSEIIKKALEMGLKEPSMPPKKVQVADEH
jgi:hypothetical protein